MKNVKKLISLLLAVGMIFSLASCGKSDKATGGDSEITASETMASNQATDAKTEDEKTSEIPSTPTEKTEAVKTDEFLKASATDKENLNSFIEFVLSYGRGYTKEEFYNEEKSYDCTSNDAFEYAFGTVLGSPIYPMFTWFEEIYGWDNVGVADKYIGTNEHDETLPTCRDPLKKFDPEFIYIKIKGSKFDMLLREVFNVTPNHDFVLCDGTGLWEKATDVAYYYNGYYYVLYFEGGDGPAPEVIINSMKEDSDGKYNISVTYRLGNDVVGYEDISPIKVVAGLKNIDGERIWSIYRIEKD